jgi:hypothetical protein
MICQHMYKVHFYRITWSGRFKLVNEKCDLCNLVRERSISIPQQKGTYPSRAWICVREHQHAARILDNPSACSTREP